MTHYDIFNGDADGICALQQLRLHNPIDDAIVITGVKRDISLVKNAQCTTGDHLTILDISLDKNREALISALDAGASADYYDHHFAGEIPDHPNLNCNINTAKDTCTSLIVCKTLRNAHSLWAIVGAFGDNFEEPANELASENQLNDIQTSQLKQLGEAINYNAYGADLDDLHITPHELVKRLRPYASPLDFIAQDNAFSVLTEGYAQDLKQAQSLQAEMETHSHSLYVLPDQAWARRVSGVFANQLATANPERAHAMLTEKANGNYLVSVRAPLTTKTGADELCRQFATGGGRQAAAGINDLASGELDAFKQAFLLAFKQ